ncbi:MAG: hypothetical protein H3C43_10260, partial [Leptonema sp. (in: Bacteria)]|nr:hypothetical protein [Leptonema sp. (in: bacteria)]
MNAEQQRQHSLLERILVLKQMIEEGRAGPVDRHDLAICYYHLENYERCANQLEKIISETPSYIDISRVYQLLSLTFVRLHRYSEAEKLIKQRLQIENDDIILLNLLGYSYEKLNRPVDAISAHRRVLAINKDHPNSLNSLGYLLTIHGKSADLAEAGSYLKLAVKLKPESPAYLDSLGMYMAKLNY